MHRPFKVLVVTVCAGAALASAEAMARIIDGYRILPLRLESSTIQLGTEPTRPGSSGKWRHETDALPYVQQLPVAAGVQRDWFSARLPDRPAWRIDADLAARAARYRGNDLPASYEWNRNYVLGAVCRNQPPEDGDLFKKFDDVYAFDPGDGSDTPRFRFLRHVTYPSGLVTNSFGWRGPEVPLGKPAQTIRLAFVGASTTVGMHAEPYSYPELVGIWFNQWARVHHPGIAFEAINAGREGVNSRSIQAIVRQELAPLEPDLVLYYEGANQFWPADYIWTPLPERSRVSGPQLSVFSTYSEIARRVDGVVRHAVGPGLEPHKPSFVVNWPRDLDEHDPDLSHPKLPIELPHILDDLDRMRGTLDAQGAHLALTSFMWLVYEGMVLTPGRDAMLFDYLNTTYWPFSYAHMRRFLDFQNRVFRKYAAAHGLDFIDIAGAFPRDPRLFDDAIHTTRAGIRLQAWIMFNGLVPIIERRLASHELPRPARHPLSRHPAFGDRRLVPMADIRAACGAAASTHE